MNGEFTTRTLLTPTVLVRSILVLTLVGGAIAVFPKLEANSQVDALQTTEKQHLSIQLSAW